MEDSGPSTPELSERKNRLSSSSGAKRNKVSRACDECRKRKVRCDGAQPCSRCQKSSTECIFSNVTPKRGPPKKYLEPFETRLKTIDSVLQALESTHSPSENSNNVAAEKTDLGHGNSSTETNDILDVTAIGHALYTPDLPARVDRIEPVYTVSSLSSEPPPPAAAVTASSAIRVDLIQSYLEHIHPSMPFIDRSVLNQPQQPSLLLNAIYAVASKFVQQQQQQPSSAADKEPPGWSFYRIALSLIDLYADVPRVTTIQAFLLLVKYQEYLHRPGFLWRTKLFLRLAVKMSNDLGLSREAPISTQSTFGEQELETRRRTFWAVYAYEILMSAELGLELKFMDGQCTVNLPSTLFGESDTDVDVVNKFRWLAAMVQILANVVRFMRSKYSQCCSHDDGDNGNDERQQNTYSNNASTDNHSNKQEFEKLKTIENTLSQWRASIPPMDDSTDVQLAFIHLIYHATIILLYRTYALTDNHQQPTHTEPYLSHCISSSFYIVNIVSHMIRTVGTGSFCKVIRGHQQILYCLTAAITIQRALLNPFYGTLATQNFSRDSIEEMCQKASSLIQLLIKHSPSIETGTPGSALHQPPIASNYNSQARSEMQLMSPSNTSSTRSSPLLGVSTLNSPHSPSIPTPSIRKRHSRSSMQFQSASSDMSFLTQSSAIFNVEGSPSTIAMTAGEYARRSSNRSLYANNRLSAPSLGSMYQQSPYFYQQQLYQQQQQQSQQQAHQQQMTSLSQPSSPTATIGQQSGQQPMDWSNNNSVSQNANNRNSWTASPRRTASLSRKRAGSLRRSASSIGEFVVPSQQRSVNRNSAPGQPYANPRRLTLTNNTPPDLTDIIPVAHPHTITSGVGGATAAPTASPTAANVSMHQLLPHLTAGAPPRLSPSATAPSSPSPNTTLHSTPVRGSSLHAMAVRNYNRFSAPIMMNNQQQPEMNYSNSNSRRMTYNPNNTHSPMIPVSTIQQDQTQQQQQQQQYHMMMVDSSSFPMDPAVPDSPNESMMGLLMTPWEFSTSSSSQQQRQQQQHHHQHRQQ